MTSMGDLVDTPLIGLIDMGWKRGFRTVVVVRVDEFSIQ
jgi:hypothetical protein